MDNTQLAYIAGLMDGEGSIIIRYDYIKTKSGYRKHGFSLIVQVAMVDDSNVLQWLSESFGGSLYLHRDKRKSYWRDITKWHIATNQALSFLEAILPFLRLKYAQAKLAIEFQSYKKDRRTSHRSESESLLEEQQYHLMKKLKGRGKLNESLET